VKILAAYAQTDADRARCKELALGQIAQGSSIVFQVAGRCGLGALDAADEKNVWGIGSGGDQGGLGSFVLTSAVENADVAVFETVQALRRHRFSGGEDRLFDVASGGVGIGRVSPEVPADVLASVQALQDDLAAGKIGPIPETVG
jgi:basic membrane protein A